MFQIFVPIISDVKYLTTSTMNKINIKYLWCTYLNISNDAYGSHYKDGNKDWKDKKVKKKSYYFRHEISGNRHNKPKKLELNLL